MLSLHDCVFIYCFAYLFESYILQIVIGLHPKFELKFLLLNKAVFKQNMIRLHHLATGALAAPVAVLGKNFVLLLPCTTCPLLHFSLLAYLLPSLLFWSTCTLLSITPAAIN